jgi:hypothetical protein
MEKFEIDYVRRISEMGCYTNGMTFCSNCILRDLGFCSGCNVDPITGNQIITVTNEESKKCAKNFFKMEIWKNLNKSKE